MILDVVEDKNPKDNYVITPLSRALRYGRINIQQIIDKVMEPKIIEL